MIEIIYFLRMCLAAIPFLLVGFLVGVLAILPEIRKFSGLPEHAVAQALHAESEFAASCPWQSDVVARWEQLRYAEFTNDEPPANRGDYIGRITAPIVKAYNNAQPAVRPWLALVGMRGVAALSLVAVAMPVAVSLWWLGKRHSWILMRRGEPASNRQRVTWAWMAGLAIFTVGILVSLPLAVPLTPWLAPAVIVAVAFLYPLRAASAARM
jgi:hypothetical protein